MRKSRPSRTPRGHWPGGRRRSLVDAHRLAEALAAVRDLLAAYQTPNEISRRALADHLGVCDRTVRRWLSGEDWPTAGHCRRMEFWVRRHRRANR